MVCQADILSADRLVKFVKDRPCGQQMLCCPEGLFDSPELLVAKHREQRVEIGVGAQHEHAVGT